MKVSEAERFENMNWADYADALDTESWSRVVANNWLHRAGTRVKGKETGPNAPQQVGQDIEDES